MGLPLCHIWTSSYIVHIDINFPVKLPTSLSSFVRARATLNEKINLISLEKFGVIYLRFGVSSLLEHACNSCDQARHPRSCTRLATPYCLGLRPRRRCPGTCHSHPDLFLTECCCYALATCCQSDSACSLDSLPPHMIGQSHGFPHASSASPPGSGHRLSFTVRSISWLFALRLPLTSSF